DTRWALLYFAFPFCYCRWPRWLAPSSIREFFIRRTIAPRATRIRSGASPYTRHGGSVHCLPSGANPRRHDRLAAVLTEGGDLFLLPREIHAVAETLTEGESIMRGLSRCSQQ